MANGNEVRQQLAMYRSANKQLEAALGNNALAKKAVVTQQMSDQLWTDPITGEVYKRYPLTLSLFTTGVTARSGVAGSQIDIFEYPVPDGVDLQFIPNFAEHFILGYLTFGTGGTPNYVNDFTASLEVWDNFKREFRGVIWMGTTTEVNVSNQYRQYGHPLVYNGDKEIRAAGGDRILFRVTTPTGGNTVNTATNVCALAFKCYQLTRMRQG